MSCPGTSHRIHTTRHRGALPPPSELDGAARIDVELEHRRGHAGSWPRRSGQGRGHAWLRPRQSGQGRGRAHGASASPERAGARARTRGGTSMVGGGGAAGAVAGLRCCGHRRWMVASRRGRRMQRPGAMALWAQNYGMQARSRDGSGAGQRCCRRCEEEEGMRQTSGTLSTSAGQLLIRTRLRHISPDMWVPYISFAINAA